MVRSFQNALVNRNKVDGEPMSQPTVVGGFIHLDRVAAILKETEVVERNSIITVFIINISVCFLEKVKIDICFMHCYIFINVKLSFF